MKKGPYIIIIFQLVIFEQVTNQNRKFVNLNCSNFIARAQHLISRCEISVMF
jgi:hypothetical protein